MVGKAIDHTGKRFGRLTVLRRVPNKMHGETIWECQCDCGTHKVIRANFLATGLTNSCGCINRIHGDWQTVEYDTWINIIQRCENPDADGWEHYGGRGIQICKEWRYDYPAFLAYVGRKPSPTHSIDRYPDNDGNYEPGNVRWATPTEQANNKQRKRR